MQRRRFLTVLGGGLASISIHSGSEAARLRQAGQGSISEQHRDAALKLLQNNLSFDLHTHPALFPVKDPVRSSNPRPYRGDAAFSERIEQMRQGGLWGGFFTLVTDAPILGMTPRGPGMVRPFVAGEGWAEYKRQKAVLDALVARNAVRKAHSVSEIEEAHRRGEAAAVYACEGGDHLEGNPARLEEVFADGVRHIQLVHVAPNRLGDVAGRAPVHNGLSKIGEEVVRQMNRLGMALDLAHASYQTARHAARITPSPLLHTHALLRHPDGRRVPAGISLDHAKLIADTGGVIGAFGGGGPGLAGYVEHILRLVEAIGIDHVGLGSDMDGTGGRSVFDDYTQLPEITAGLLSRGLSEDEVSRIIGGNLARVLREVSANQ